MLNPAQFFRVCLFVIIGVLYGASLIAVPLGPDEITDSICKQIKDQIIGRSASGIDPKLTTVKFIKWALPMNSPKLNHVQRWSIQKELPPSCKGTVSLPIRLEYSTGESTVELCSVYIDPYVVGYRLLRNINYGDYVEEADLKQVVVSALQAPPDLVTDLGLLPHLESKANCVSGGLLTKWMLRPRSIVFRDDPVNVEYRRSNVAVKISGVALQNGGLNEKIRVKVGDGTKILLAKIVDSNLVVAGEIN